MTYKRHKQSCTDRILEVLGSNEMTSLEIIEAIRLKYPKKANVDSIKARISLATREGLLTKSKGWPPTYKKTESNFTPQQLAT